MVSPLIAMLSVFITPWTNPSPSTARSAAPDGRRPHSGRPARRPARCRGHGGRWRSPGSRAMTAHSPRGEVLERAHPQMAGRHPRQHTAPAARFRATHPRPSPPRPARGGGHAQRVHRLGNQVFPQHRPDRRLAVAPTGKHGAARSLQMDVEPPPVGARTLAQQQRPPVAQTGENPPNWCPHRPSPRVGHRAPRRHRTSLPHRPPAPPRPDQALPPAPGSGPAHAVRGRGRARGGRRRRAGRGRSVVEADHGRDMGYPAGAGNLECLWPSQDHACPTDGTKMKSNKSSALRTGVN